MGSQYNFFQTAYIVTNGDISSYSIKARGLITNWQKFLEDNQNEITALHILYHGPHMSRRSGAKADAKRHLVYEELNQALIA